MPVGFLMNERDRRWDAKLPTYRLPLPTLRATNLWVGIQAALQTATADSRQIVALPTKDIPSATIPTIPRAKLSFITLSPSSHPTELRCTDGGPQVVVAQTVRVSGTQAFCFPNLSVHFPVPAMACPPIPSHPDPEFPRPGANLLHTSSTVYSTPGHPSLPWLCECRHLAPNAPAAREVPVFLTTTTPALGIVTCNSRPI
ncbi:hypothetical protein B0T19DRAFT_413958 [Cercophora scortea]|uniref:Uncharacterized protein n=1 Tax=Cercophora scortea TaxID=314031 RepID=A0AAE0IV27_9PEZI|nr:hypothetical protein B0T19DRAFT_413958 [Cercophora scortea]